jgi:hypothetical protein
MELYNTFTNYYLAIGAFCLASVYFPIESFLTLIFYGWLHYECEPVTELFECMFTDPFARLDEGKNKMMKFIEALEDVERQDVNLSNAKFVLCYYFIYKGYFNFWDPVRQEYMIFDTDFNGRTIFYYIDKSHFTAPQKKYLKNAIVKSFKNYLGIHFEPYRVARKEIKRTRKFLDKTANELLDARIQ